MRPGWLLPTALLAAAPGCTSTSPGTDASAPTPPLSAGLSSRWSAPYGEHVVAARQRDDSSVVVVRENGRITVLNFDLTERPGAASSAAMSGGPVSAATTCDDGTVVVLGGAPRSIARLESGALRATHDVLPSSLGDVHALSCATASDVLMLVDPIPIEVDHPSLLRTNTLIVRLRAAGALDTLATLAGHAFLLHGGGRGWSPPPFAGELHAAVGTTVLYVGITVEPAIRVVQTNGRTVGSIAYIAEGSPVARSAVDSALRNRLRPFIGAAATPDYVAMVDSLAVDRRTPSWSALAADAEDNLWIGTTEDGGVATRQWRILAADGSPVGKVLLPGAFEVFHVTGAGVLGRWRAADGAEEVRRYAVGRSALAARGRH